MGGAGWRCRDGEKVAEAAAEEEEGGETKKKRRNVADERNRSFAALFIADF